MSTDNNREWSIDPISPDDPNNSDVDPQAGVDHVFEVAREQLEIISQQSGEHSPTRDAIKLAKKELRIMELTNKLELASQIIDQQKATIARLKGDN